MSLGAVRPYRTAPLSFVKLLLRRRTVRSLITDYTGQGAKCREVQSCGPGAKGSRRSCGASSRAGSTPMTRARSENGICEGTRRQRNESQTGAHIRRTSRLFSISSRVTSRRRRAWSHGIAVSNLPNKTNSTWHLPPCGHDARHSAWSNAHRLSASLGGHWRAANRCLTSSTSRVSSPVK